MFSHPLDTLKTKMQAQDAHLKGSSLKVFSETVKKEGIVGLYRCGCIESRLIDIEVVFPRYWVRPF